MPWWKQVWFKWFLPIFVLLFLWLLPAPSNMPPQAWLYFGLFIAMIIGMILEPIPATAVSFVAVTIAVVGNHYLLFDAHQLNDPQFSANKTALHWGLSGFSSPTVWLVFSAFIFALGYKVTGLGQRIALLLVKFMGKRSITLGYAIVMIDVLLAPFMPSNTARTGGTVFPVIENLPALFKSYPQDASSKRIGSYLMWMMIIGTSISSSMFITGAAPNLLGVEFVSKQVNIHISWLQWFLAFLPVGIILLIIAPWLAYILYKPSVTSSTEVSQWATDALHKMGPLSVNEIKLIVLVVFSLILWVIGGSWINATSVGLLAVAMMLLVQVVQWNEVIHYSSAWNTLVNLATLVVMANGLSVSGFIAWFSESMSFYLVGFSSMWAIAILVLVFYFAHYLFASLSAHTATLLPVILAIGQSVPGIDMEQLAILLVLSIGIMGVLTPYATGPGVIIYNSGYISSQDYWRLGFIFGCFYMAVLLLIGWPLLSLWV